MWDAGGRFALRALAPYRELGEDMTEGITLYVKTIVEAAFALANGPSALAMVRKLEQRPLTNALKELNEDSGGMWLPALVAALCPVSPLTGLTLAGLSSPLQLTYLGCAGISLFGVHKFYGQSHGLCSNSQSIFKRAMVVMLLSSGIHILLANGGLVTIAHFAHVPEPWIKHIIYPDVFLYSAANLFFYPAMLLNLGYIAGARPSQMVPCTTLNTLSTGAMLLSSTDFLPGVGPLFCTGTSMVLFFGGTLVMSALVEGAAQLSFANRNRVEHTIDAMMFFWSLAPLVQAFTILDSLGHDQATVLFALIDVTGKLGTLHIMLKSRPAMEAAGHHFEDP
jgi:hypothetical protein